MSKKRIECTFRIVTAGDAQVGKSNLVTRFSTNEFTHHYQATIGVDFSKVPKQIGDSTINALIWDLSGQDRFLSISSSYYKFAVGAILVYGSDHANFWRYWTPSLTVLLDITSYQSFKNIKTWLEHIQYYAEESPFFLLIGNKLDLAKESRAVDTKEAAEYARDNNMLHFETSALDSIGVEDAISSLIKHIYENRPKTNNTDKPKDLASAQKIIGGLVMNKKELEDKINDLEPYKKKCEEQEVEIRRLKQEIEQLKDKDNHLEKIMQVLQSSGISNKINSATASTMRPTDDNDDPENDIYYDDPVV